jgi:hypothetical protein
MFTNFELSYLQESCAELSNRYIIIMSLICFVQFATMNGGIEG